MSEVIDTGERPLRIGETATVWEYPETGKLVEEKPGISWPLLLFGSFFLLIGLATASGLVRSLRAPSVARHRLREALLPAFRRTVERVLAS